MAYTPVEIRHVALKRGLLGYGRAAVDRLLEDIATSFEDVWRERADLADRVEQLEAELQQHREREALLASTLIAAERAAADAKEDAQRKAEQLLAEAHAEARSITRTAISERERLLAEVRRIRSLLRAALDVVVEDEPGEEPAGEEPAPEQEQDEWPRREDTREFELPEQPSLYLSSEPRDAYSA